jgi:hypothetical protein
LCGGVVLTVGGVTGVGTGSGAGGDDGGGEGSGDEGDGLSGAASTGLSEAEQGIATGAKDIFHSPEFEAIQQAHASGQATEVEINGVKVLYEPELPASGMTLFGEHGFIVGPEAFQSEEELAKTIAHESFRLATSTSSGGVPGRLVLSETIDAAAFAEKAWKWILGA